MDAAELAAADSNGTALGDLLGPLEGTVLRVVHAGDGLAANVRHVTIFDRTDPSSVRAGALVLGIGVDAGGADAVAVLDSAARRDAAGVVLRGDDVPHRIVEIAGTAGLAIFAIPAEMEWGQLYSLLLTAMATRGANHAGDTSGVAVGDLFALADAIAAAVDAPVTIEDAQWRVLAYSNLDQPIDEPRRQTILGRTPPPEWQRRLDGAGVLRRLRGGDDVVRFEYDGLAPRLAAPIRAGSEMLGAIWLAEGTTPLGPAVEDELLRAAQHAAVHLIAHRASEDVVRRTRGAYVREVLAGHVPDGAAAGGASTLQRRGPFTVAAFQLDDQRSERWTGDLERILSLVSLFAESLDRDAMSAVVDERIWALVPTPQRHARERLLEFAEKVVQRAERVLDAHVLAGVGSAVPRVVDIPQSRRSAEQALAVLVRRRQAGSAVHIDDVRPHAALLEVLDFAATRPTMRDGPAAQLARHDADHGTEYLGTLRAYLDCHGDVARAAGRVGVHTNTLRYRLRRLAEVARLHLDDPDERVIVELELRVLEHAGL